MQRMKSAEIGEKNGGFPTFRLDAALRMLYTKPSGSALLLVFGSGLEVCAFSTSTQFISCYEITFTENSSLCHSGCFVCLLRYGG